MKRLSTLAFATTLFLHATAFAAEYYPGVVIFNGSARGSMMGAKHNAENGYPGGGYISCSVWTADGQAPRLSCGAGNQYRSIICSADAVAIGSVDFPRMMDAALGIDAYSFVSFSVNSSGYCTNLSVGHNSEYIP